MRSLPSVLIGAILIALAGTAIAADLSADANRLAKFLDGLGVESRWPAGVHINWETGIPDGKPEPSSGKHTHCSAFVAAAAKRLGIYILRPPEHGQILLANAQYDWLRDEGKKQGWFAISDGIAAQDYANRGYLVAAAYKSHNDNKPGHIAIVRPSAKSRKLIEAEGPQVIQAGEQSYQSASLKIGFASHPAAWAKNEVRYYGHAVAAGALKTADRDSTDLGETFQ